jgi:hypothetical protein
LVDTKLSHHRSDEMVHQTLSIKSLRLGTRKRTRHCYVRANELLHATYALSEVLGEDGCTVLPQFVGRHLLNALQERRSHTLAQSVVEGSDGPWLRESGL